ncbi:copper-binding protein [Caballeronia sp. SEWSISQ10-4 2]|uniref:copper-binding protein n=1 Tax=Caballeronia sp. SEWSISQ10-4 2 TaxID=2937438 RepID=UPI00264F71A0|nr:copper-binding protein [Caballeronia sp. SEWSISQ10-4 2]MDN7178310.1 copper-binding protein [Caballeronia sp. SEWSISQ10-4 2]
MNKLTYIALVMGAAFAVSQSAVADDMAGMKMGPGATSLAASSKAALTDAEIRKVDPASGMVTLKHGALENVGMPAMTMAFKARDAAMLKQAHQGDKVRVRVENVAGTMTIVTMEKQ